MFNLTLINLKTEQRKGNYSLLSDRLIEEINLALQNKQKVILFHNRKGYARRIICSDCRYLWVCPKCGLPMISEIQGKITCLYCKTKLSLTKCPKCKGMQWKSLGYGLQKIKQELIEKTNGKIEIIDAGQSLITKCDILLCTQPSLLDCFDRNAPPIALAAILNADTDFYLPDFTAGARVFNRIIAFKKFCREFQIRQSIIQTYSIKNKAINAASRADFDQFAKSELAYRRKLNYPPYSQLIKLTHQNKNQHNCKQEAQQLYNKLKQVLSIKYGVLSISPPQPTFIPMVRGNWRYQIVIKVQSSKFKTQNYNSNLKTILKSLPPSWLIDVDPISLL